MKTGDLLPNGAVVLEATNEIVLAKRTGYDKEYVTWDWDGKDNRSTIWGHYYRSIGAAAYDYESRIAAIEQRRKDEKREKEILGV